MLSYFILGWIHIVERVLPKAYIMIFHTHNVFIILLMDFPARVGLPYNSALKAQLSSRQFYISLHHFVNFAPEGNWNFTVQGIFFWFVPIFQFHFFIFFFPIASLQFLFTEVPLVATPSVGHGKKPFTCMTCKSRRRTLWWVFHLIRGRISAIYGSLTPLGMR